MESQKDDKVVSVYRVFLTNQRINKINATSDLFRKLMKVDEAAAKRVYESLVEHLAHYDQKQKEEENNEEGGDEEE